MIQDRLVSSPHDVPVASPATTTPAVAAAALKPQGGDSSDDRRIAPRVSSATREVPLSNGKVAVVRRVSGRHMVDASIEARAAPVLTELVYLYALTAQVATIDEERLILDDFWEMPGDDVDALIEAVQGTPAGKGVLSSGLAI